MKKFVFIINNKSGKGEKIGLADAIERQFQNSNFEFRIEKTNSIKEAEYVCTRAVLDKIDVVVACGGDGTINQIAKLLKGSETALGIIPLGSGNGLARHLKVPMNTNGALEHLKIMPIIKIDTCSFDGHFFVNVAGIGLDGVVAKLFQNRNSRGLFGYIILILKTFFGFKPINIKTNGEEKRVLIMSFANSSQYGNHAIIAPGASLQDGMIDICTMRPLSAWYSIGTLIRLLNGSIKKSPFYHKFQQTEVLVETDYNEAHVDGESFIFSGKGIACVLPEKLKVVAYG